MEVLRKDLGDDHALSFKQLKKKGKEIKAWTIYLWRNGDKYEGTAGVVTKDGFKDFYRHGWEIEKVPDAKRNEDKHQAWRAKINVKNILNNTLNVVNWYGKRVLDKDGNIDTERLRAIEVTNALSAYKQGKIVGKAIQLDDLYPIKKFPIKEITAQEAREYKFI